VRSTNKYNAISANLFLSLDSQLGKGVAQLLDLRHAGFAAILVPDADNNRQIEASAGPVHSVNLSVNHCRSTVRKMGPQEIAQ